MDKLRKLQEKFETHKSQDHTNEMNNLNKKIMKITKTMEKLEKELNISKDKIIEKEEQKKRKLDEITKEISEAEAEAKLSNSGSFLPQQFAVYDPAPSVVVQPQIHSQYGKLRY